SIGRCHPRTAVPLCVHAAMAAELEPRNSTKGGGGEMITREKLERQQREREAMQQAIAAYTGPITKCPPGKAAEGPPRRRASSQDQPKNAPTQNSEDIRNADFTPCFTNEEGQATG